MAQFATAAELETQLGATFTAAQHLRADQLLQRASAAVVAWCNAVALEEVANDVITLRGRFESELPLPRGPVTSVSEVRVDGEVITDYELVKDRLIRGGLTYWPLSPLFPGYANWGGDGVEVQVTYTHGYSTPPDEVKTVVLDMASRVWENPGGLRSETIASDYQRTFAEAGPAVSGGLMLSAAEKQMLRRYRRNAQAVRV